jgi:hypothetical protein
MVKPSKDEAKVLHALASGHTLKSHRYLDGTKIYQLHLLEGSAEPVQKRIVDALQKYGLVTSNQKFPAATYSLTQQGREVAALLEEGNQRS